MSVAAATRTGDRRKMFVALQYRIARAIDDPDIGGPALAALLRQQMDIAARIEVIDLAAQAVKGRPSQPDSVIATTPDEAWDESMI